MIQLDPAVVAKINDIDLTNCRTRLMDPKLGEGWSAKKADAEIVKYRRFLMMISTGMQVVPTLDVDQVWHTHILDTSQYTKDCQTCFGRYIHHFPYIGDSVSKDGFSRTKQVYKETFGEDY